MEDEKVRKKYLQRAAKGVERLIYIIKDLDLITKGEAPHFARSTLDMSSIAPSLTGPAPTATAVAPAATAGPPANSTLMVVLTAVMVGSLVVNLVLLALLLAS